MHLRDISLIGLSKIILIAFLAFPLMASLLLLVLFLLGADVGSLDFRVPFGTPRETGAWPVYAFYAVGVVLFILKTCVAAWFSAAFIRFLAVFTALGKMKIGYSQGSEGAGFPLTPPQR